MHVCAQTLVLIDNDLTETDVSRKITDAALKYMFYHKSEDRAFCVNTYEHDITDAEEYMDSAQDLVYMVDKTEYADKDISLTDTLSSVIARWKEADFACRDILVFTDGIENEATEHEKEELYYLLEKSGYPVYIVMLDQENNKDCAKGLSAIATTSGGKLFNTEFEGSEAQIEKTLAEKITAAMDEYKAAHWAKYEESGETTVLAEVDMTQKEEEEDAQGSPEEDVTENVSETVLYERSAPSGVFDNAGALVVSAALIAIALFAGVAGSFLIMKRKRKDVPKRQIIEDDFEDDLFDDYDIKGIKTCDLSMYDVSDTVLLSDTDGATRLLTDTASVTLTDETDKGRRYRVILSSPMTLGRGDCDVSITGDDAVSKRHCELFARDGSVYVRDLSSSNGTKVNDVRIKEEKLSDGDRLTIGARSYIVETA